MDQCVSTDLKQIAFWKGLQAQEKQDMSINNKVTYLRQVPAFSAQGLQQCFSALPGYFCHDILGKEKFLLLFLLFLFYPCKGSGAGPAPPFCCAQQPGVQGRRHSGDISLQHQLGTVSHCSGGRCWISQLWHPK